MAFVTYVRLYFGNLSLALQSNQCGEYFLAVYLLEKTRQFLKKFSFPIFINIQQTHECSACTLSNTVVS